MDGLDRGELGTRDDDGLDARTDLAALEVLGGFAEVGDATVGAGTEEADVDLGTLDRGVRRQLHVGVGVFGGLTVGGVEGLKRRHLLVDEDGLPRGDAPGDGRADILGLEDLDVVILATGVGSEGSPAGDGGIPIGGLRGVGLALDVIESLLVRIDVTAAGTAFDGHVADRHALLEGEGVEGRAGVFVGVTDAAVDAEDADDVEDDVLGVDARGELAVDLDATDLEGAEGEGLGREDVADLRGADAEGDRAERAVGGGMGVAAGDGGAGLGDALLRTDHVDDALGAGRGVEEADAVVLGVLTEGLDHLLGDRVGIGFLELVGRDDVVDRGEGTLRVLHLEAEVPEHAEGLGARHLVDEVRADEQLGLPVRQLAHRMRFPNFLEQGLGHLGKR